jgi:hypothetical protein
VAGPEREEIQALDRTQPGLPLKPGKAGTMTHDDKRNGITTLFAALDGTVLGRCMRRHRHQESVRFLDVLEGTVPAGELVHVILRQLRQPQAPRAAALARPSPPLRLPLHAKMSSSRFALLAREPTR